MPTLVFFRPRLGAPPEILVAYAVACACFFGFLIFHCSSLLCSKPRAALRTVRIRSARSSSTLRFDGLVAARRMLRLDGEAVVDRVDAIDDFERGDNNRLGDGSLCCRWPMNTSSCQVFEVLPSQAGAKVPFLGEMALGIIRDSRRVAAAKLAKPPTTTLSP